MSELGKCLKITGCEYGTFCEMAFSWTKREGEGKGRKRRGRDVQPGNKRRFAPKPLVSGKMGKIMKMGEKCKGRSEWVEEGVQEEL